MSVLQGSRTHGHMCVQRKRRKELAHTIMQPGKFKMGRAGQQAGDSEAPTWQLESESPPGRIPSGLRELSLVSYSGVRPTGPGTLTL